MISGRVDGGLRSNISVSFTSAVTSRNGEKRSNCNRLARWGTLRRDSTHVFARDVPHVAHIHDATLMPHDAHGNGVLAHLGGHVAIHLDAQLLQHQQACTGAGQRAEGRGQRSEVRGNAAPRY